MNNVDVNSVVKETFEGFDPNKDLLYVSSDGRLGTWKFGTRFKFVRWVIRSLFDCFNKDKVLNKLQAVASRFINQANLPQNLEGLENGVELSKLLKEKYRGLRKRFQKQSVSDEIHNRFGNVIKSLNETEKSIKIKLDEEKAKQRAIADPSPDNVAEYQNLHQARVESEAEQIERAIAQLEANRPQPAPRNPEQKVLDQFASVKEELTEEFGLSRDELAVIEGRLHNFSLSRFEPRPLTDKEVVSRMRGADLKAYNETKAALNQSKRTLLGLRMPEEQIAGLENEYSSQHPYTKEEIQQGVPDRQIASYTNPENRYSDVVREKFVYKLLKTKLKSIVQYERDEQNGSSVLRQLKDKFKEQARNIAEARNEKILTEELSQVSTKLSRDSFRHCFRHPKKEDFRAAVRRQIESQLNFMNQARAGFAETNRGFFQSVGIVEEQPANYVQRSVSIERFENGADTLANKKVLLRKVVTDTFSALIPSSPWLTEKLEGFSVEKSGIVDRVMNSTAMFHNLDLQTNSKPVNEAIFREFFKLVQPLIQERFEEANKVSDESTCYNVLTSAIKAIGGHTAPNVSLLSLNLEGFDEAIEQSIQQGIRKAPKKPEPAAAQTTESGSVFSRFWSGVRSLVEQPKPSTQPSDADWQRLMNFHNEI
ncbi:MAG: hypothetical protein JSS32_05365 [Verrucomicrobia bacterium]|nr:hypothetical protein [Verrucomicrobiota bacterium]